MKLKALICALLVSLPLPAFAALVGQTCVSDSGSTSATITLAYTGTAIVAGDDIVLATTQNTGGGEGTITYPTTGATFVAGSTLSPAVPDVNIDSGASFLNVAVKIAASGDAGNPTYTTALQYAAYYSQCIFVFSGRVNSSVSTAFNNQAQTGSSAEMAIGTATPAAYSVTRPATLSGDDVLVIVGSGYPFGANQGITLSISGYSNQVGTHGSGTNGTPMNAVSLQTASAASSGSLASSSVSSTSTTTIAFGGVVFALPAAAASFTPKVVLSTGHVLMSNGHPVIQ